MKLNVANICNVYGVGAAVEAAAHPAIQAAWTVPHANSVKNSHLTSS
jgi:hypothetical protein